LHAVQLRCLPRARGEPRDEPRALLAHAHDLAADLEVPANPLFVAFAPGLVRLTADDDDDDGWPRFALCALGALAGALDQRWRAGALRGLRLPPPGLVAAARTPRTWPNGSALLAVAPAALRQALAPFQAEGAAFLLTRRRALLADEMGAGKTLQAIAAVAAARATGGWPVLIACPAGVRSMWASELERWLPGLTPGEVCIVRSSLDAPEPPPAPQPQVLVISFHMLERLHETGADGPFRWPSVIVDEAHLLAASSQPGAGVSRQAAKVLDLLRAATHLAVCLSGTPAIGRPLALFPLLDTLACGGDTARGDALPHWFPERRVADRRLAFCRAFCGARMARGVARRLGRGAAVFDGVAFDQELHATLAGLWMLRRLKRDVLPQLPPLTRTIARLDDVDTFRKRSHGVDADSVCDDEGAPVAESDAAAFHAAGRVKTAAAAAWVISRLARDESLKLVVFAHHVDVLNAVHAALEAARAEPGTDASEGTWIGTAVGRVDGATACGSRANALQRFRDDARARALLVSVTAGGIGVDLSAAAEAVFVESVGLRATWLRQAEDRLHRRGQRHAVIITYLLAPPGSWEDARWPRVHASLRATSALVNGEAAAEAFTIGSAPALSLPSAPSSPLETPKPLDVTDPVGPTDLEAWAWAAAAEANTVAEAQVGTGGRDDAGQGLFFEVSPHSGRVHLHGAANGSRHLGANFALADVEAVRAAGLAGGAAAAAFAARSLPRALRSSTSCAAAWRFCRDWGHLTTRQRSDLMNVCAAPPLAAAVAKVHVARAQARVAPSTRRHTPWRELVSSAASRAGCETQLVRLPARERLGLAPIAQAVSPAEGLAKCLACPEFYRCAPRGPGPYRGSLLELFCSSTCREAYSCRASGSGLRRVVFARDGGVCAACGADGHALVEVLRALAAAPYGRRFAVALSFNPMWARHRRSLDRLLTRPTDGLAWEADHAVRVADGGGEALANAVQTLCIPCHREKTRAENLQAVDARKFPRKDYC